MKQTIEIDVPNGKKAVWRNGKIEYENLPLPNTWEEFCKQNEIKKGECLIDDFGHIKEVLANERCGTIDKNVLPNKQAAKAHLALTQLHQLRDCYRQGWKPNWKNREEKFCIGHYSDCYRVDYSETASYFLAFQSEEIAEKFIHNFRDLIEQAGDLI